MPIGRSRQGKFVAHPKARGKHLHKKDRWARTRYSVLRYFKNFTALDVEIVTGRTHQIRAHLTAIGHPIVGDTQYVPKKKFLHLFSKKIKVIDAPRIMLHSQKIGFRDLSNKKVEYFSKLPQKITAFIKHIT